MANNDGLQYEATVAVCLIDFDGSLGCADVGLSQWTMLVSAEDFIPSLAGYVQSLDIITALRLCNRYGKGTECFVNKLPTEMIELIEAQVHVATRQEAFTEWEQQRKCTEGRCACDYDKHRAIERKELQKSYLASYAMTANDSLGPHDANVRDFCLRTRGFRALDADAQLVRKYFGLDIWTPITHSYDVHPDDIRLRPLLTRSSLVDVNTREQLRPDTHRTRSQLFFMLPGYMQRKCSGRDSCPESFAIAQDFMAASRSDRNLMRRFLRVFRLLGLQTGRDLRLLEAVVNLTEVESADVSNRMLRERVIRKVVELGRSNTHVIEGKAWPDILHVQRRSSWESRMQTGWLAKNA